MACGRVFCGSSLRQSAEPHSEQRHSADGLRLWHPSFDYVALHHFFDGLTGRLKAAVLAGPLRRVAQNSRTVKKDDTLNFRNERHFDIGDALRQQSLPVIFGGGGNRFAFAAISLSICATTAASNPFYR